MSKYKYMIIGLGLVILGAVIILWATVAHSQTETCTAKYTAGTIVTLTAKPCPGWAFVQWSGACTGKIKICKVTMDNDKSVHAEFKKIAKPKNLRVAKNLQHCLNNEDGYITK